MARQSRLKRSLLRWSLAGPGALAAAVSVTGAMPLWFPAGAAGLDHLVLPLVLFPVLWALALIYAVLEENLARASLALLVVTTLNGGAAAWAVWGPVSV